MSTGSGAHHSPSKRGIKDEAREEYPGRDGNSEDPGDRKGKKVQRATGATKVVRPLDGDVTIHAPAHWEEVYDAVREMRKDGGAPVDTMGCERLADPSMSAKVWTSTLPLSPPLSSPSPSPLPILTNPPSPQDQRFQTLLALMLSSQTRDAVTASTMHTLQHSLPGGLTLASILATSPQTLTALIRPVGFHNVKTAHILATAALLAAHHGGDIPATAAGLMALPGVGPKMAFLCASAAWGRTEGIGVDVHVHRVTNRWGWHRTRGPEETRRALEAWLPRERWREVNALLVGFGQVVCRPVGRRCGGCEVGRRGLCPSKVVGKEGRGVGMGGGVRRGGGDVKGVGGRGEEGVVVKEEEEEEVLEGGSYVLDEGEERVKVEDVEEG